MARHHSAVNTSLTIHDSHPRLTFTNGSQCKSKSGTTGDATASTAVEFICDTSVFGAGQPRLVAQLPPDDEEAACAYVLEWRTHVSTYSPRYLPINIKLVFYSLRVQPEREAAPGASSPSLQ